MPALAASDVTVALELSLGAPTGIRRYRKSKEADVKITFGDGALTHAAGGVPLPAFGSFGFEVTLDDLIITDQDKGNGIIWKFDKVNKKLVALQQNLRMGSTTAADSTSGALVEDENAAETVVRAMGSAVDTDIGVGFMKEVGTSFAPAAQTLFGVAKGW